MSTHVVIPQRYEYSVAHDPVSKMDFIDRILRRDFTGDLTSLAAERNLRMERISGNKIRLHFGTSGKIFDLAVHMPKSAEARAAARTRWFAMHPPKAVSREVEDTLGRAAQAALATIRHVRPRKVVHMPVH